MADMIIKPSSGNSLVFQDEGGDAALTIGTTGTITTTNTTSGFTPAGITSSATGTAITIDSSNNVTLAGTANNLGTATAGTLGSAVVFPTGTVIKVHREENSTRASFSQTAGRVTFWTFTYVKAVATSNLLCLMDLSGWGSSADTSEWEMQAGSSSWVKCPKAYQQQNSNTKSVHSTFWITDSDAAGSQTISVAFNTLNNASNKPFDVWNPDPDAEDLRANEFSAISIMEVA